MRKMLAQPALTALYVSAAAWTANFLAGRYAGYPFLICWFREPAAAMYLAWGTIVLYGLLAYVAIKLLSGSLAKAIIGALVVSFVIEMPRLAHHVLYSGGSCG